MSTEKQIQEDNNSPFVNEKELDDKSTITVFNISFNATENELRDFFSKVGTIKRFMFLTSKKAKKHIGIAYITFDSPTQAENAVTTFHNAQFADRVLRVENAYNQKTKGMKRKEKRDQKEENTEHRRRNSDDFEKYKDNQNEKHHRNSNSPFNFPNSSINSPLISQNQVPNQSFPHNSPRIQNPSNFQDQISPFLSLPYGNRDLSRRMNNDIEGDLDEMAILIDLYQKYLKHEKTNSPLTKRK